LRDRIGSIGHDTAILQAFSGAIGGGCESQAIRSICHSYPCGCRPKAAFSHGLGRRSGPHSRL